MNEQVQAYIEQYPAAVAEMFKTKYREELRDYKITPKGMVQIYVNQNIPTEVLKKIFQRRLINKF